MTENEGLEIGITDWSGSPKVRSFVVLADGMVIAGCGVVRAAVAQSDTKEERRFTAEFHG